MAGYDSLILDHDGVLVSIVDSDTRIRTCCRRAADAFRDVGVVPDAETIEKLAFSVSPDELHSLSDRFDATPERLWRCRDDLLAAVLKDAARNGEKAPYPDVEVLSRLDVPLGIASNNQHRIVSFVVEEHGLDDHFETIHAREPTLDSLDEKKPSPTYLRRAKADLGVSNPLYVGDKEKDVVAGKRAGIDVAFLRRDHNADRSLAVEPTHEVSSLEAVAPMVD